MKYKTVCSFCGSTINLRDAFRFVTGWERDRKQGGTNALALRTPTESYACYACISARKHTQTQGQEALFG